MYFIKRVHLRRISWQIPDIVPQFLHLLFILTRLELSFNSAFNTSKVLSNRTALIDMAGVGPQ